MRHNAVHAFKHLWHHAGLAGLARRLQGGNGAILRYHSVTDDESTTLQYLDSGLMVTADTFERQLHFIGRCYTVVSLDEMVDRIHAGKALPRRAVAITFDDGYRDNYTLAYPLLRAAGMTATFYVTTGTLDGGPSLWTAKLRFMLRTTTRHAVELPEPLGGHATINGPADRQSLFTQLIVALKGVPTPRRLELVEELGGVFGIADFSPLARIMMSWREVREMHDNGMTIGAHTITHPNLPRTDVEEMRREIVGSGKVIAEHLGAPTAHFSYPNGRGSSHVNETVRGVVRDAGFRSAVTSLAGCIALGADPWELRRVGIYNRHRDLRSFSLDVERSRLRRA